MSILENTALKSYVMPYLNPATQALLIRYPAKGFLCLGNAGFAVKYSRRYYASALLSRGNSDAFRYIILNFGMTIDVGTSFAKRWSDAHEFGLPNNPELDMEMDLFNNNQGILLGIRHPNTLLHRDFISRSMSIVDRGHARRIVGTSVVESTRSGKKITISGT
ncbi:MAG: DUF6973 domain-containing protein [Alkaliphilus sp.]